MQRMILAAALAALSACAARQEVVTTVVEAPPPEAEPTGWRTVVTQEDGARLDHLSDTWTAALASARRYRTQIQREGDLLVENAARPHPAPPPGSYRCRLVKLGTEETKDPPVRAYPEFFCYIRGDLGEQLFFAKQTGTERPSGWLHPDGDNRLILLGATQATSGDDVLSYGQETGRDLAGVFERIGPFRWRLVLPWRSGKPGLDIFELTPVPVEQQAAEPVSAPGNTEPAS